MTVSWPGLVLGVVLWNATSCVAGAELESLKADRRAVERVYHDHRLGTKPPFEEAVSGAALDRLVRLDLHKEALLRRHYRVAVTPAEVEAEVTRIRRTTRAPEMLAEIEAALGHDPDRFARTVARPLVVDRLLRGLFANDEVLHAGQRRRAETARSQLLAAQQAASYPDTVPARLKEDPAIAARIVTWRLTPRPALPADRDLADGGGLVGPQAEVLQAEPGLEKKEDLYFEDLPADLHRVLKAQLTQPGAVSAVIELPLGFLVYRVNAVTEETLTVLSVLTPKSSYEQWLAEQKTEYSAEGK